MRDELTTMLKTAMKAGDKRRVGTVRLIQAALKDKDIEARGAGKAVGPDDMMAMLQKMVKQRQDSLVIYEGAGREDLATQEREELAIISEFLPQALSEDEVRAAITASSTTPPARTDWTSESGATAIAATWKIQAPVAIIMPIANSLEEYSSRADRSGWRISTVGA